MAHVRRRRGAGPVACGTCKRPTGEPRKGLCYACYQRERRGAVVNACAVCGLADARMLMFRTLADGEHVLCGNHALALGKRRLALSELARELRVPGDRRASDRRAGDRRAADRRASVDLAWLTEGDRRSGGRRLADHPSGEA